MKVIFNYISDRFNENIFNSLFPYNEHEVKLFTYPTTCETTPLLDKLIRQDNKPLEALIKHIYLLDYTSRHICEYALQGLYYDLVVTVIDNNNHIPPEFIPKLNYVEQGIYQGIMYKPLSFSADPNVFLTNPRDFIVLTKFWKMADYFTPRQFATWNPKSMWKEYTDEDGYKLAWGQWIYMNRLKFKEL